MFADALYMQIELPRMGSAKHARGKKTMTLYLPGGPKIPFTLEIVADAGSLGDKEDAALLMRGPGDFIFYMARTYTNKKAARKVSKEEVKQYEMCVTAIYDGRQVTLDIMRQFLNGRNHDVDKFLVLCKPIASFVRTGTNTEWTPL
jgi:hypothetical protein